MYGLYAADDTFENRLSSAYGAAMQSGVFENTYRTSSVQEYWAEGVQDYYDTNVESIPANGVHNSVNTRGELLTADPTLHALIAESFPENLGWPDCHNP